MGETTVFFDIGGTLLETPDIFEDIIRRLTGRWPDDQTCELVRKTYENLIGKKALGNKACIDRQE